MFTTNLNKIVTKRKKRVGRGYGSGKGSHTSTRGQKGQTSRGGYHAKRGFEGGQIPLSKRLPKMNGNKSLKEKYTSISITTLLDKEIFEIDAAALKTVSVTADVKLVGATSYENYDLKKVTVKNDVKLTKALREKIVASGGTVEE